MGLFPWALHTILQLPHILTVRNRTPESPSAQLMLARCLKIKDSHSCSLK